MQSDRKKIVRSWVLVVVAVIGLLLVFVFQQMNAAFWLGIRGNSTTLFLWNRSIRFFLNDAFALLLIYGLFYERKYLIFAVWVQAMGIVFFLIPYFILKLYCPAYNGPLISFLHRLILNPTLLLLLVPAFYYQKVKSDTNNTTKS
jgi:hypothetical protein